MEEYRKYEPIFGSWYLKRLIGRGSFGKVFEITREEFGTVYRSALKIITIPQDESEVMSMMTADSDINTIRSYYEGVLIDIVNENEIMAQLKGNSNIVSYEDHQIVPHENGVGYDILIRMELLEPLIRRMMQEKLDEREVAALGIDMCKALEICHRKNIIHRDIKPQNIFISENGDYKLGDFGIARTMEKTSGEMSRKGTYKYMAPEVYRGDDYDSTADIYSLGIVLYTLLNNNRSPFLPSPPVPVKHTDEDESLRRRMRGEQLPQPDNAGVMMTHIIRKACAFDPRDRYRTADLFRKDLESIYNNYDDGTVMMPLFSADEKTVAEPEREPARYTAAPAAAAFEDTLKPREISSGEKNRSQVWKYIAFIAIGISLAAAGIIITLLTRPDSNTAETPETAQTAETPAAETPAEEPPAAETPAEETPEAEEPEEEYIIYSESGYHTMYFDTNGGDGSFSPIEVATGDYFSIPSKRPVMEGSSFMGWYVERLEDGKWYSHDLFTWIYWDGSYSGDVPSLYEPGQSLLFDDSWGKNGGTDSNYVFHAVWSD